MSIGFRPASALLPLGNAVKAGRKRVTAFAMAGDIDATRIESVSCAIEWPPNHGRLAASRGPAARNGLRSTSRETRSSRDKASLSIAWNKSCGRYYRSEKWFYPSSSG